MNGAITDFIISLFSEAWKLAVEMAPYLFLGFAVAGILHVFLPVSLVSKHLGGESKIAVLKSSFLGIPLPLCSCGVLPVAASLRKAGAGRAPTLSFLITTPVTGVDSLLATWALLGGIFTLVRLFVSIVIGVATGFVMSAIGKKEDDKQKDDPADANDICEIKPVRSPAGFFGKFKTALNYGFVELPSAIAGSILTGLLLGGVISVAVPPEAIQENFGTGIFGILVAVAFAIPLYVCATGSIPIAAVMVMKGFSPGAALAFLIAGPATNAVAFTTVKKILGTKPLVIYLASIFVGSLGFGMLFDILMPETLVLSEFTHHHRDGVCFSLFQLLSGGALVALLLLLYIRESGIIAKLFKPKTGEIDMGKSLNLSVPDMTCQHCKATVTTALKSIAGVKSVSVDLSAKKVSVELEADVSPSQIISSLANAGYEAKPL